MSPAGLGTPVEFRGIVLARRNLLVGLPLGLLLPSLVHAQQGPKVIGVLNPYTSPENEIAREVFVRAMLELGYVRGKHYVLVERFAEGEDERLNALAAELTNLKVDLILASSTNAVIAA